MFAILKVGTDVAFKVKIEKVLNLDKQLSKVGLYRLFITFT